MLHILKKTILFFWLSATIAYSATFTIESAAGGTVDATELTIASGASSPLTVTSDPCYAFETATVKSGSDLTNLQISGTVVTVTVSAEAPEDYRDTITVTFTESTEEYTLAIVTNEELGTPLGSGTASCDEWLSGKSISAEPAACALFDHWEIVSGDASIADTTAEETSIVVNANTILRAHYLRRTYNLTVDTDGTTGAVITAQSQSVTSVSCGISVPLETSVPDGYAFSGWVITNGEGASIDSPDLAQTAIQLNQGPISVQATFAEIFYTVTPAAIPGVTYTPSGETTVAYGEDFTFTVSIVDSDSCDIITDILINDTSIGSIPANANSTTVTHTVTNITQNVTITPVLTPRSYTLTILHHELGTDIVGDGTAACGAPHSIGISPITGYHFREWEATSGNIAFISQTDSGTATVRLTGDATITARFDLNTYTIHTVSSEYGTIAPSEQVVQFNTNSQVFTVTPNINYQIADVLIDSVSQGPLSEYRFVSVTQDHTLEAVFTPITHTVTVEPVENGTISPSGTVSVQQGSNQTFTISPDPCHEIVDVSVNGESVGAVSSYEFFNIQSAQTINAQFKEKVLTLTVAENELAQSISGSVDSAHCDSTYPVSVTLNEGTFLREWTAEGEGVVIADNKALSTTVTLTNSDAVVTADIGVITRDITYSNYGEGIVLVNGQEVNLNNSNTYAWGTELTISAIPDSGWLFYEWEGDYIEGKKFDDTITIAVTESRRLKAVFISTAESMKINCGGPATDGFLSDRYYIRGNNAGSNTEISGTDLDPIYSTVRHSSNSSDFVKYTLPLIDGLYTVTFLFAEQWRGDGYTREFSIEIEDTTVAEQINIFAAAGDKAAYELTFNNIAVTDLLHIYFRDGPERNDDAMASGIIVTRQTQEIKLHTVTLQASPDLAGQITARVGNVINYGPYESGTSITLHAIPDSGFSFIQWGNAASGTENPLELTVNEDLTVSAFFDTIHTGTYTITIPETEGGHVTFAPTSSDSTYAAGSSVELQAVPDENYRFSAWSGAATGTEPTVTISSDTNITVSPVFIKLPEGKLSLTVNKQGEGLISISPQDSAYDSNTVVEIIAEPIEGWLFHHYSGDFTGASPIATVTMNTHKKIVAHFIEQEYTLSLDTDGHGTTKPGKNGIVKHGDTFTIQAVADEGYHFTKWDISSGALTISDSLSEYTTVTLTEGDAAIRAEFERNTYTVSVRATDGNTTFDEFDTTVTHGDTFSLSIIPPEGEHFVFNTWQLSEGTVFIADSTKLATTFVATSGNLSLSANYTKNTAILARIREAPRDWQLAFVNTPGKQEIRYAVPLRSSIFAKEQVSIRLFDIQGRLVNTLYTGYQDVGFHSIPLQPVQTNERVSAGSYICAMRTRIWRKAIRVVIGK